MFALKIALYIFVRQMLRQHRFFFIVSTTKSTLFSTKSWFYHIIIIDSYFRLCSYFTGYCVAKVQLKHNILYFKYVKISSENLKFRIKCRKYKKE